MQEEVFVEDGFEEMDDSLYDEEYGNELPDEQELFEHYRFVVDKGQSMMRIDKYLVNIMASISRNRIQDAVARLRVHPCRHHDTRSRRNRRVLLFRAFHVLVHFIRERGKTHAL